MLTNSVFTTYPNIIALKKNCELPMTLFKIYRIHAYLTLTTLNSVTLGADGGIYSHLDY